MSASTEAPEHACCIVFIDGLGENLVVDVNSGVSAENDSFVRCGDHLCFFTCETFDISHWRFIRVRSFIDIGRDCF
jgi:hypothetical protein